ncbi:hypothetical protein BDZ90DRAFT_262905 [Jaminaea rosea]|uniref:Uncharacterized protein n=1 Tax=Jaminaea rosea TaxID=1569628 RepID=A0A316UID9_9BASI|nr:hypothetical protein BDZ90DRAFT_262905 [Jaminaea rosea]PWN24684.1 hypothetical protein BDZ90DRAFT_262905 [Jaminaea rosea]
MTVFLVPQPRLPDARVDPVTSILHQQDEHRYVVVPGENPTPPQRPLRARSRSRFRTALRSRPMTAPSDSGSSSSSPRSSSGALIRSASLVPLMGKNKSKPNFVSRSLTTLDTRSTPALRRTSTSFDADAVNHRRNFALVDDTFIGTERHLDDLVHTSEGQSMTYEERLSLARQALQAKLLNINVALANRGRRSSKSSSGNSAFERRTGGGGGGGDGGDAASKNSQHDTPPVVAAQVVARSSCDSALESGLNGSRLRPLALPQRHPLRPRPISCSPVSTIHTNMSATPPRRSSGGVIWADASTQTSDPGEADARSEQYDLFPADFEAPASRGLYAPVVIAHSGSPPCITTTTLEIPHTIPANVDTSPLGLTYESFLSIGSSTPDTGSGSESDSLPSRRGRASLLLPPHPEEADEQSPPVPPKDYPHPGTRISSLESVTTGGVSTLTLPTAVESAGHGQTFGGKAPSSPRQSPRQVMWRGLAADAWAAGPFLRGKLTSRPLFRRKNSAEGVSPSISSRTEDRPVPPVPAPASEPNNTVFAGSMLEWFEQEEDSDEDDPIEGEQGEPAAPNTPPALRHGSQTKAWIRNVRDQHSFEYCIGSPNRPSFASSSRGGGGSEGETKHTHSASEPPPLKPILVQPAERPSTGTASTVSSSRHRRNGYIPPPAGPPLEIPLPALPLDALPKPPSSSCDTAPPILSARNSLSEKTCSPLLHPHNYNKKLSRREEAKDDANKGKEKQRVSTESQTDERGTQTSSQAKLSGSAPLRASSSSHSHDSTSTVQGYVHNATPSTSYESTQSSSSSSELQLQSQRAKSPTTLRRAHGFKVLMKLAPPSVAAASALASTAPTGSATSTMPNTPTSSTPINGNVNGNKKPREIKRRRFGSTSKEKPKPKPKPKKPTPPQAPTSRLAAGTSSQDAMLLTLAGLG